MMNRDTTPKETPIDTPRRVFVFELKISSHWVASDSGLREISIYLIIVPQQDSKHWIHP